MSANNQNTTIKDTIALFLITLVAGLALGFVFKITEGPIQALKDAEKAEAYQAVYSEAAKFSEIDGFADVAETSKEILAGQGLTNTVINEVLEARSSSDEVIGYVFNVTNGEGYGGEVPITIGVAKDGTINAIEVLANSETSGFGSRASEPEFKDQFKGIKAEQIQFTKTGKSADNEVDAVSGATKTTTAVTKDVNAALYYVYNVLQ
ncbi:MAG: FMN-binding protein [bacterium]|nr:FMN-binding protein [bacterium]